MEYSTGTTIYTGKKKQQLIGDIITKIKFTIIFILFRGHYNILHNYITLFQNVAHGKLR